MSNFNQDFSNNSASQNISQNEILPYFAPLLPWQTQIWQDLQQRLLKQKMPHALLFSGIAGLGKRSLVWRFLAWTLCENRQTHLDGACENCASCQWLKAGTHPALKVLPPISMPTQLAEFPQKGDKTEKKSDKPPKKTETIKIDDIRALQDFINQGSQGRRFCVFDNAEYMTTGAANALLKTLEEPEDNLYFILISNRPDVLLPTIKSRVQQINLAPIDYQLAKNFVQDQIKTAHLNSNPPTLEHLEQEAEQALQLADYAPLKAIELLQSPWYAQNNRQIWLKTWQALRTHQRTAQSASDYWQNQISLNDFIALTTLMMIDVRRTLMGLPSRQTDLDFASFLHKHFLQKPPPDLLDFLNFDHIISKIEQSIQQNVQEKIAYDKIMQALSNL